VIQSNEHTKDSLQKKTVQELKEICRGIGVKHTNQTKDKLIAKIVEFFDENPENEKEFHQTKKEIESKGFSDPAPQHLLYKKEFNAVDLLDKLFYQNRASYPIHHWRTKLFFSLFQVFLINSCTLYNELFVHSKEMVDLMDFRNIVAKYLLIINEEDVSYYRKF
jgi:hypothetical protein